MKLQWEDRIPLDADRFWDQIHSPRFEAIVAEAVGLREYRELERREEDGCVYRRIQVVPTIPKAFGALLRTVTGGAAGNTGYVEEQWRSADAMEVRWKITPSYLSDRSSVAGVDRIEPIDDRSCRRVTQGEVRVRLIGLGPRIERAIAETTRDGYAKTAQAAERLRD